MSDDKVFYRAQVPGWFKMPLLVALSLTLVKMLMTILVARVMTTMAVATLDYSHARQRNVHEY